MMQPNRLEPFNKIELQHLLGALFRLDGVAWPLTNELLGEVSNELATRLHQTKQEGTTEADALRDQIMSKVPRQGTSAPNKF